MLMRTCILRTEITSHGLYFFLSFVCVQDRNNRGSKGETDEECTEEEEKGKENSTTF